MTYEYLDIQTGKVVCITKPASQCDPIGAVIVHEGRRLKRLVSGDAATILPVPDEPRARRNVPKNMPGFPTDDRGYVVATNAELRARGFVENPHLDNPAWRD